MASRAAGTSEGRLELLEARVLRLEEALARLSHGAAGAAATPAAIPVSESGPDRTAGEAEPLLPFTPRAGTALEILSAIGTSFLVLGGAFLIRTFTESGALPAAGGIAVGYAYALGVIASADRVARTGRRILAAFLLATAIGIGNPLVYEAVTRFHAAGAGASAAALALLAGTCLAAAWHRGLAALAWVACLAVAAASYALAAAAGSIVPFAMALLAVGVAVEWTPGREGWRSARWPSAFASDAILLWLATAASSGRVRGTPPAEVALLLALPLLFVGGIAARTFATHREAGAFEAVQSFAASAIGLGGALAVIRASGRSPLALGVASLIAAAACYWAALAPLSAQGRPRANASLAAALALGLALFGSACVLSGAALAWAWIAFAVIMAGAARAGRPALQPHVVAFVLAAAWQSGLAATSVTALLDHHGRPVSDFGVDALVTIVLGWAVLVAPARGHRWSGSEQLARLTLAIVAGLGAVCVAVAVAAPWVVRNARAQAAGVPGEIDAPALALLRSGALSALALAYALSARGRSMRELGGLAYAVMVLWSGKLLVEDVPVGRPLTLFAAFALYGTTLLLIPRLRRHSPTPAEASEAPSPPPIR